MRLYTGKWVLTGERVVFVASVGFILHDSQSVCLSVCLRQQDSDTLFPFREKTDAFTENSLLMLRLRVGVCVRVRARVCVCIPLRVVYNCYNCLINYFLIWRDSTTPQW